MESTTHFYSGYSQSSEMVFSFKICAFVARWQTYITCAMVPCPELLLEWWLIKNNPSFLYISCFICMHSTWNGSHQWRMTRGWENTDKQCCGAITRVNGGFFWVWEPTGFHFSSQTEFFTNEFTKTVQVFFLNRSIHDLINAVLISDWGETYIHCR